MSERRLPPFGLTLVLMGALGCEPSDEVGRCNDADLARTVVFDAQGYPAYAGQALVQVSCGNGSFCHSSGIPARNRLGVPHGLDFDMVGSRGDPAFDEEVAERLRVARNVVFEWREEIMGSVTTGFMPPGDAGEQVQGNAGYRFADGTPLPAVGSARGVEILRQWLACGPPVVGSITSFPIDIDPVGDVVPRGAPTQIPDATWSSIYEIVIGPQCGQSCHGPGPASQIDVSGLDLSTAPTAYAELVGVEAEGNQCAGMGTLVVSGEPGSSLLIDKMENGTPTCGDPMPPSPLTLLPADLLAPIREWIEAGAMDN